MAARAPLPTKFAVAEKHKARLLLSEGYTYQSRNAILDEHARVGRLTDGGAAATKRGKYDDEFLVRQNGPEVCKGYRFQSSLHDGMCADASVASNRPALSLERYVAAHHQHAFKHRRYAHAFSHSKHTE